MANRDRVTQQNETAFRTCFRLEQPHGHEAVWRLRILLQAADDPSLLVPAELVWQETSETLEYLNYRFPQPHERLLSDLGKAGKLFAPIERSLQGAHPAVCELNTDEAHLFLNQAAQRLNKAGFGVFIPSWWHNPEAQLGVKMKIKNTNNEEKDTDRRHHHRKSTIGFNTLLDYEWELASGDDVLSLADFEQARYFKAAFSAS